MALLIKQTDTFRKWERALGNPKAQALIAARLNRIAYGLLGDVKSVGDNVSEIRILLCGGDKGTQKRDIAAAKTLAAQLDD